MSILSSWGKWIVKSGCVLNSPEIGDWSSCFFAEMTYPYPEMEFLNGIFLGLNSILLCLEFNWFCTLVFQFYKMLFMNRLEFLVSF